MAKHSITSRKLSPLVNILNYETIDPSQIETNIWLQLEKISTQDKFPNNVIPIALQIQKKIRQTSSIDKVVDPTYAVQDVSNFTINLAFEVVAHGLMAEAANSLPFCTSRKTFSQKLQVTLTQRFNPTNQIRDYIFRMWSLPNLVLITLL